MPDTHAINYRLICVSNSRGLQQYTARLANAMAATGRVHLTVVGQEPLLALLSPGIEVVELPGRRYSLRTLLAVARALFGARETVLHYQGINLVTLVLLYLAGMFGRRTLLTPHNVETHFRNRAYNAIKWPLWRGFNMIVLHTEAELRLVPRNLRSRVCIIPHGEYAPPGVDEPVSSEILKAVEGLGDYVIAPGFVRDDKNTDFLVENISVLKNKGIKLVVAGRNQSSFPSARIAAAATHFDGFLPDGDLTYLIRHAVAVVLPYDKVSESGILHQALSVGTPVIVSDIPGFRERIRERENGLFLRGFNPSALEEALAKLVSVEFDRAEIKRRHLAEFSWDAIAAQLLEEVNERRLPHE